MNIQPVISEAVELCRKVEPTFTTLMLTNESLLPTDPDKRLEVYGQALRFGLDAGIIADQVGIVAGWGMEGIESEGLCSRILVTDQDGNSRPSSLAECIEGFLKGRPKSSRSSLYRSHEALKIYKILEKAGVKFPRAIGQSHLLAFKPLKPEDMPVVFQRMLDETNGDPDLDDCERGVNQHLGKKHKRRQSSFKALKVKGAKIIATAMNALANKDYEVVAEAHQELIDLFSLKRKKKSQPGAAGPLSPSADDEPGKVVVVDGEGNATDTGTVVTSLDGEVVADDLPTKDTPKEGRGFTLWANSRNVMHVQFSTGIERKELLKKSFVDGDGQAQGQYSFGRSDGHKDSVWRHTFATRALLAAEVVRLCELLEKA
jgi:hypothetical protein